MICTNRNSYFDIKDPAIQNIYSELRVFLFTIMMVIMNTTEQLFNFTSLLD
ncbi:protein of unknown function [Nitrosotalea devaniterrae]|uniref:Uncharacterized protein n=1 Tax=Nitrosotalea devaniterrae TaxID=1078905 RepID=A0A128A1Y5_9ARCH|nr:protein of unknown function [Candidatus Nitrosotalea devanaterra]